MIFCGGAFPRAGLNRYDICPKPRGGNEATRVHHADWRSGGNLAARGARAATRAGAADRSADGISRKRLASTELYRSIPGRTSKARVDGWPQRSDRNSLDGARQGIDAT